MSWLNPWGWLWLGMAIPVIMLYILRIRRRRVMVSTTQFWEEILAESRPRAWWQRLRHLVSLILQLLLLLLLTAALSDPLSASQSRDRRLVILLVDRSASMHAHSAGNRTRFEHALDSAHREVDALREWDEAIVIGFAGDATISCGRTSRPGELHRALDGIQPSDRSGDASVALALASRLQAADRVKSIMVFTDQPPVAEGIQWRRVGEAVDNLAITALSASVHPEQRTEFRVLTRLANYTEEARIVSATLRMDGEPIDVVSARLDAGESRTSILSYSLPDGGLLSVQLNDAGADGLAADNLAHLALPPPRSVRVGVVANESNWFLDHALTAIPLVEVIHLSPMQNLAPANLDLVVFDRVTPAELPPVHSLFIQPDTATRLWQMGDEPLRDVLVSSLAEDSPLLRYTRFERVTIRAGEAIVPNGGATLLGSFGWPLLHVWEGSDIHRAALMIDLQRSDLALRTAFPILVANLVQWCTGRTSGPYVGLRPGAEGPDGPLEKVGLYESADGWLCVNLADAGESDLRPPHPSGDSFVSRERPASRPWWQGLTLTALALVTVEWGLHQRRWVE